MGDRLLATIIELERSLQGEIRRETALAEAWCARELAALAREGESVRCRLAEQERAVLAAGRAAAEKDGERLLAAAEARGAQLEALTDAQLTVALRKVWHRLLPEDDHDHPHGQG
ncbi:MAG: hypothetical protein FDZ69_08210 [Deltaproteobacteria bacterium]|nr:MAG: hypothetical protein FDZ69_08210 [Deltaproteobacteria bacterium]